MKIYKKIEEILIKEPNLRYYGMWHNNVKYGEKSHFFNHIKEIKIVIDYLKDVKPIKTFNKKYSSYTLKHWVENANKNVYIANGVFILGALLASFKIEKTNRCPNVYFNMSNKSLKILKKDWAIKKIW